MTKLPRYAPAIVLAALLVAGGAQGQTDSGGAASPQGQAAQGGPATPLPAAQPRAPQPQYRAGGATQNPDWPCIQPRVPQLSWGQMWSAGDLTSALEGWRDDKPVADLVPLLAARRTSKEEASAALDAFTETAGAEKNAKLTLLFAGVFSEINDARSALINGIERYSRKQRALSERIKETSLSLASEGKDMAAQNTPEYRQKEEALNWDTRIYDERAHSLTYVCESPVLLEQLAFERGRDIQARMD